MQPAKTVRRDRKFPGKFPESYIFTASQISSRISRNVQLGVLRTAGLPKRSRSAEANILEGPRRPRARKSQHPPNGGRPPELASYSCFSADGRAHEWGAHGLTSLTTDDYYMKPIHPSGGYGRA